MREILYYLLVLIFLATCTSDYEKVQGHWHYCIDGEYDYFENGLFTLDFDDSLVSLNTNDNSAFCRKTTLKLDSEGLTIESDYLAPYGLISFKSDTLIIGTDENYPITKWVKVENNLTDVEADFNRSLIVSVDLETNNASLAMEEAINGLFGCLSIGLLKTDISKPKYLNSTSNDSIYIQVNDVIIDLSEIELYLFQENEKLDQDSLTTILINADKNVSDEFMKPILNEVFKEKTVGKVYKTYLNERLNTIGLLELQKKDFIEN